MKHDLRFRLFLTCCGITLVAVILLGTVFAAVLGAAVSSAHVRDMRAETSALAAQLDRALSAEARRDAIQHLIRRDSVLLGKRIVLLDRAGHARFDSARWTPFSRGSWRAVDLGALRRGQWARLQSRHGFGLQSPLFIRGHEVGGVALVITAADSGVPWGQIVMPLLAVLGALLLVWLGVSIALAHSLSRPLHRLSAGLIRVKQGNYDGPLMEEGWSETRSLARRYNDMVSEVARSRQAQRDFVANASHELKTPVALVAGFARSLSDGTAARGDAMAEAVRYIQAESEHMARVVDQLFLLASLDADAEMLRYAPCCPDRILRETAARFAGQARSRRTTLEVECDPQMPTCVWDEERIASALSNLISNALEHSGGGTIHARVSCHGTAMVYQVQDSGLGISPEDVPHVFERFYRGRGKRVDGHAGLGLALVLEIVQRHGGAADVVSRVGEGTCFTLSIPRVAGHAPEVEPYSIPRVPA